MRGKDLVSVHFDVVERITPAYAGKSAFNFCVMFRHKDHPRLCGEKAFLVPDRLNSVGSPPPMRGKEPHCHRFLRRHGITPAYAGKSNVQQNHGDR